MRIALIPPIEVHPRTNYSATDPPQAKRSQAAREEGRKEPETEKKAVYSVSPGSHIWCTRATAATPEMASIRPHIGWEHGWPRISMAREQTTRNNIYLLPSATGEQNDSLSRVYRTLQMDVGAPE